MTTKKEELYLNLSTKVDKIRSNIGMETSQFKDYVLTLFFLKSISEKFLRKPSNALIVLPEGCFYDDIVALKGDQEIGEKLNIILFKIANKNELPWLVDGGIDFNNNRHFGSLMEMINILSDLIGIFEELELGENNSQINILDVEV